MSEHKGKHRANRKPDARTRGLGPRGVHRDGAMAFIVTTVSQRRAEARG